MFEAFFWIFISFLFVLWVILVTSFLLWCCEGPRQKLKCTNSSKRAWRPSDGPDPFWCSHARYAA